MFLPPELLTLFFLANAATAVPQGSILPNVTVTDIPPSDQATFIAPDITGTFGATATESVIEWSGDVKVELCTPGFTAEICCSIHPEDCNGVINIPSLPSETGWEETDPATDRLVTLTPSETTITTIQPTILSLETHIATAGFDLNDATKASSDNNGQPFLVTGANAARSSNVPGQSGSNTGEGDAHSATGVTLQQTEQNSLLLKIVSQIGGSPSNAQPASPTTNSLGRPVPPTSNNNGGGDAPAQPATAPNSGIPSDTKTASLSQVTPAVGTGYLVVGESWTVTLTPGLSINLGGNMYPTMLEMTTDGTGNTLVTVSSSGTAVTATVRVALTTMTVPKSGFEASVTEPARPGDQTARLATTSSKGAGANRGSELEWWTGAVLGILGFAVVL